MSSGMKAADVRAGQSFLTGVLLLGEDPNPTKHKWGAGDLHEGKGQVQGQ